MSINDCATPKTETGKSIVNPLAATVFTAILSREESTGNKHFKVFRFGVTYLILLLFNLILHESNFAKRATGRTEWATRWVFAPKIIIKLDAILIAFPLIRTRQWFMLNSLNSSFCFVYNPPKNRASPETDGKKFTNFRVPIPLGFTISSFCTRRKWKPPTSYA